MIFGIGTDIVAIARISQALKRHGPRFAQRILSPAEQQDARSRITAQSLAKSFAAKEAFAKASGLGLRTPMTLHNLSVVRNQMGKPCFTYADELAAWVTSKHLQAHLSLSDEQDYAVAMVVLEKI